jgi:two-component system phosphate regulon response regulator PhoB
MADANGRSSSNAKQIFIVEDDAAIAEMLIILLEMEGYEVVLASTALEGLHMLTEAGSIDGRGMLAPDLILLDLNLPGMDGAEMVRRASQDGCILPPLIILSAKPTAIIASVASSIQAAAVVHKPFRIEVLLEHIQRVLFAAQ